MGVAAKILVKIRGKENWLSNKQRIRLSYELGSSVGHDSFCMTKDHDDHILEFVKPHNEADYKPELIGKTVFFQDGPTIVAEDNEQFLKVHTWSRYYGPSYERGNWCEIFMTIQWLRAHVPPESEVWYGGDSSGIVLQQMTDDTLEVIQSHWLQYGNRPYVCHEVKGLHSPGPDCPRCLERMTNTGGGPDRGFYYCPGCGREEVVWDDGTRRLVPKGSDFFKVNTKLDGEPVLVPGLGGPVAEL